MFNCLKSAKDFKLKSGGYLYIDVGTSIDAPTTADWILNDPNANIVAIEPYRKNIDILREGRDPTGYSLPYLSLDNKTVLKNGEVVKSFDNPLLMLECAIDRVTDPIIQDFYCTGDLNTGCSSLLKPNEKTLGIEVAEIAKVETVSLAMILDEMKFDGVTVMLKTDTQGKDFDVVRSMGKHLLKTFAVKSEYNTWGQYQGEPSDNGAAFEEYMKKIGFSVRAKNGADILFVNERIQESLTVDESHHLVHHISQVVGNLNFRF